jgi:hypothetical protein
MKKIALVVVVAAFSACRTGDNNSASDVKEANRLGFDGCYHLVKEGDAGDQDEYPAICLQGTAEEGINGAGVLLATIDIESDQVIKCFKSSASGMTRDSFTYESNGQVQLELKNVKLKNRIRVGDAIFGGSQLKFTELNSSDSRKFIRIANRDRSCKN